MRPTYVITHPVASDARSAAVLRQLQDGGDCEIGAHHHAWETPPCTEEDVTRHPYASTLSRAQFAAQVEREVSPRARASEMEHAIRFHIREHMDEDPVHYQKLSERLQWLRDQEQVFQDSQRGAQQQQEQLLAAVNEKLAQLDARQAEREAADRQLEARQIADTERERVELRRQPRPLGRRRLCSTASRASPAQSSAWRAAPRPDCRR